MCMFRSCRINLETGSAPSAKTSIIPTETHAIVAPSPDLRNPPPPWTGFAQDAATSTFHTAPPAIAVKPPNLLMPKNEARPQCVKNFQTSNVVIEAFLFL